MKIVQVEQGSQEWHEVRSRNVMGTDTVVNLMGAAYPYEKTPRDVAMEKLGFSFGDDGSSKEYIFAKGHEAEEELRNEIAESTGLLFLPAVGVIEATRQGASWDGYLKGKGTMEAKLVGDKILKGYSRQP